MPYKSHYCVLGISRGASQDEIRRAYRRLVRQYHPDVNPNAPDAAKRLTELSAAYEVLRDSASRERYDRLSDLFSTPWHTRTSRPTVPRASVARRPNPMVPVIITFVLAAMVLLAGVCFLDDGAVLAWFEDDPSSAGRHFARSDENLQSTLFYYMQPGNSPRSVEQQ
jgi:curved DNA-binding protein CbpA